MILLLRPNHRIRRCRRPYSIDIGSGVGIYKASQTAEAQTHTAAARPLSDAVLNAHFLPFGL